MLMKCVAIVFVIAYRILSRGSRNSNVAENPRTHQMILDKGKITTRDDALFQSTMSTKAHARRFVAEGFC